MIHICMLKHKYLSEKKHNKHASQTKHIFLNNSNHHYSLNINEKYQTLLLVFIIFIVDDDG